MPISQITGASIQDGSIVVADLGITTFNTGTGNTLTLQANSATGLVISVTGNTAIANSLSFSSTGARITGDFSNATQSNRVAFQTSTSNGVSVVGVLPNGTGTTAVFRAFNNSDPTNAAEISLFASSSTNSIISGITGSGTYLPLTMLTGGSERLRIDTSGNVGIGTTTPTSKLGVFVAPGASGSSGLAVTDGTRNLLVQITGSSYSYNGVGSNENLIYAGSNPLSFLADGQSIKFCAGTTERMRILSTGNIGIGTTSPSQLLHVAAGTILASNTSSTTATVSIAGNGSTVGTSDFALQQGTSSEAYVFNRANSYLVLGTNNTERMRIDASGNVGIGTSSPAVKLDVVGNSAAVQASETGGASVRMVAGGSTAFFGTYSNHPLAFYTDTTERMRITTGGSVGIGTGSSVTSGVTLDLVSSSNNEQYINVLKLKTSNTGDIHPGILFENNRNNVSNAIKISMDSSSSAGSGTFVLGMKDSGGTFNKRLTISNTGDITLLTAGTRILNSSGNPILRQTGSVLQVVQAASNGSSTSSTSFVDSGLSASISPTSSTSKILVTVSGVCRATSQRGGFALVRNSTQLFGYAEANGTNAQTPYSFTYLDSPATTSSTTYKLQISVSAGGGTFGTTDVGALYSGNINYITLVEIAA